MLYENFLEAVRSSVQEKLDPGTSVTLRRVLKNNGVALDGLSFSIPGIPFSPTVYLNDYFPLLEEGVPLSVIVDRILFVYEEQHFPAELEHLLADFEAIRKKIVYKLIGADGNEELLADIPHFRYLDLAVVFYLILSEDPAGQITSLIHNEHLKLWNLKKEQLLDLAEKNTPLLLPARICPIEDMILENEAELGESDIGPEELVPVSLYVLTNPPGINGAACLLYPGVLKNFAEQEEDDLILLPSSIHEVLIAPAKKALSYPELNEMIQSINQSDVPPEDRLSDHIYRYYREQNCILIPAVSAKNGKWNPQ